MVNYTEYEIPYTRVIEHKHFEFGLSGRPGFPKTVITREYPAVWKRGEEPYYPINDDRNNELYRRYAPAGGKLPECDLWRPPGKIPVLRQCIRS